MDLTGEAQHVFEKDSTVTAGLTLQSMITRALNQTKFCLMSSLELSAEFNNQLLSAYYLAQKY